MDKRLIHAYITHTIATTTVIKPSLPPAASELHCARFPFFLRISIVTCTLQARGEDCSAYSKASLNVYTMLGPPV